MKLYDENGKIIGNESDNSEDQRHLAEYYARQAQKKEGSDPNKLKIAVKIDNTEIQQVKNENDQLKAENESVKEVKAFFDAEKQKASEKLTALGIETSPDSIRGNDDLIRANKTIEALKQKDFQNNVGGQAPLSGQYSDTTQKEGTYASHAEMVNDLIVKEKTGNKTEKAQAKATLDAMTLKVIKGAKEGKIENFDFPKNESIIDRINETHRQKILALRGNQQ